jgi:hypothetical protein
MAGTAAELDLGRMLYLNRVPFRYVLPQGVKGKDYDVEILFPDDLVACAGAKCALENRELSTIRGGMSSSRPNFEASPVKTQKPSSVFACRMKFRIPTRFPLCVGLPCETSIIRAISLSSSA